MAIKVTIGESETQDEKPFPKLMKYTYADGIVLFKSPKVGTVIKGTDVSFWPIGEYKETWEESLFTDYNEPITIQNQ